MPAYLAFLRGINLGKRRPKMDDLRALFEALKFTDVTTFIASGNVAFNARSTDADKLRVQIEAHLHASLGYEVDTFLRTRAELAAVAVAKPFPAADMANADFTVTVTFLHAPLDAATARKLLALGNDYDTFAVDARWPGVLLAHAWTDDRLPSLRHARLARGEVAHRHRTQPHHDPQNGRALSAHERVAGNRVNRRPLAPRPCFSPRLLKENGPPGPFP